MPHELSLLALMEGLDCGGFDSTLRRDAYVDPKDMGGRLFIHDGVHTQRSIEPEMAIYFWNMVSMYFVKSPWLSLFMMQREWLKPAKGVEKSWVCVFRIE